MLNNAVAEKALRESREWARAKIASEQEPPWAWFQYMRLVETVDAILGGMSTTESSQQEASHRDARLRLVDSTYRQDTAQSHPDTPPIRLPM